MTKLFSFINRPERAAYLFILPAVLILLFFTVIPLVASVVISLLQMDPFLQNVKFIGADNFAALVEDERFWNALKNTIYFAAVEMPLQVVLALLVAAFVSKNTLFRKLMRSIYFVPVVCSMAAISIVWSFLLDPQIGSYPYYLSLLGLPRLEFLRDPNLAMPSVILMTVWKNFGYSMVILIAGIQSIPDSYYEAAEIDGASKTQQFFNVTIPMLIPAISFCVITNTIGSLQVFDQIYVATQGGPLFRTESIVAYIYSTGFSTAPYNLGYSSAIAVVLFVIIIAVTLLMNNYFLRKETSDV
ncbi:MAG TPA: sugar ABC transporter permease [Paenibacillus sp.]|uniref:carbohydrate ABC transporter permease n=1 Tax=Paenibacillus sp. TaxID=58172 RepID=UPI002D033D38|nr:sugar ABC transporter permease [Paenibacillus sp.]HUC94058.1 sugar ABC transporter permease [Paenibacillus sp.]